MQRSDYKSVWNSLSTSRTDAVYYVCGYVDEEKFHRDAEDTYEILRETVGIRPTDTFLEIGCGVGRVGQVLAPFIQQWIGCDVSGYDLSPIPDASVDVVYSTVVFMHLDEWDRYNYVLDAMRVLKPGGRIYCDNVDLASANGWAVFEESRKSFKPQERPPHLSKCSTQPELQAFLTRAGFTDVRVAGRLDFWAYAWGRKPL